MLSEVLKDLRIIQSTDVTGTHAAVLQGAPGCRSFYAAFGDGGADVFLYMISHRECDEWEVGTGHLSDAATLQRDTVVASSNGDKPVDFSRGLKDVTNNIYEGFHDTSF